MRMRFNKKEEEEELPPEDPTAWMLDSGFAEFILMHTAEIRYMCMFGYTFLHGAKLFNVLPADSSLSYKFVSMIFQCTGGGILVPIFINSIPVPLAQDAYPIAIIASFLIHQYIPIVREILKLSPVLLVAVVILYETQRASVVVKLTTAAAKAIAASEFSFPLFGPIFCGTVAGCGGMFLPLNKGLDPIRLSGMAQPIWSAFAGATFYHLFTQTSLSEGVMEAPRKAHLIVTCFFIAYNLYMSFPFSTPAPESAPASASATIQRTTPSAPIKKSSKKRR